MKRITIYCLTAFSITLLSACSKSQQDKETSQAEESKSAAPALFLDVHNLEPGKVTLADVAAAHEKDLATQGNFGVSFVKYWVDEAEGKVYCLAEAKDSASIAETHKAAHGLVPDLIRMVSDGIEASITKPTNLFLDIHHLGPGKVTASDVAGAHEKDLAVQDKHDVRFINYWVDAKSGDVVCLSEAPNADSVVSTHREAHGLVPDEIRKVSQGQ